MRELEATARPRSDAESGWMAEIGWIAGNRPVDFPPSQPRGSAWLDLGERWGRRAPARRTGVRRAHLSVACGNACGLPGAAPPPTASPVRPARAGRSGRALRPSRTLPRHPARVDRAAAQFGPVSAAVALARSRRKGARRWAVPCHGAWQGTARQRGALRRPQALSSARLAPGLREGLTPPPH